MKVHLFPPNLGTFAEWNPKARCELSTPVLCCSKWKKNLMWDSFTHGTCTYTPHVPLAARKCPSAPRSLQISVGQCNSGHCICYCQNLMAKKRRDQLNTKMDLVVDDVESIHIWSWVCFILVHQFFDEHHQKSVQFQRWVQALQQRSLRWKMW